MRYLYDESISQMLVYILSLNVSWIWHCLKKISILNQKYAIWTYFTSAAITVSIAHLISSNSTIAKSPRALSQDRHENFHVEWSLYRSNLENARPAAPGFSLNMRTGFHWNAGHHFHWPQGGADIGGWCAMFILQESLAATGGLFYNLA